MILGKCRIEEVMGETSMLQRFTQEAQLAARIRHPSVVRVYDVGEQNDIHYIVMEYLPGVTLDRWLKVNGTPPSPTL